MAAAIDSITGTFNHTRSYDVMAKLFDSIFFDILLFLLPLERLVTIMMIR